MIANWERNSAKDAANALVARWVDGVMLTPDVFNDDDPVAAAMSGTRIGVVMAMDMTGLMVAGLAALGSKKDMDREANGVDVDVAAMEVG
jgi:hypothetical protein